MSAIQPVDVVILSALPVEHWAVTDCLRRGDPDAAPQGSSFTATIGGLVVVAVSLSAMGNVGSAAGAQQAIDQWHPRFLLLVGITAGVGDVDDIALGDVVVADMVVGYEPGKHHADGLRPRPDVHRPAFALLAAAKEVRDDEWVPRLRSHPPLPVRRRARVHIGTVLTGEKVLADARVVARLRQSWPTMVGVEMEGLGVATASHRSSIGFLLIKGISDFADAAKDDVWRQYASEAAAVFCLAMLEHLDLPADQQTSPDRQQVARGQPRHFGLAARGSSPCRLVVVPGDIVDWRGADIWVNSENVDMEMCRITDFSISAIIRYLGAIRDSGGRVVDDVVARELSRQVIGRQPVRPATAIVTSSGGLAHSHNVAHIIHVASVIGEPGSGFRQVRTIGACVTQVLTMADQLAHGGRPARTKRPADTEHLADGERSAHRILFPLLGVGTGGGDPRTTAIAMADAAIAFIAEHPHTPLTEIQFLGYTAAEFRILNDVLTAQPRLTALTRLADDGHMPARAAN